MKNIKDFNTYFMIKENNEFSNSEFSIKYNEWSEFKNKLDNALQKGFSNINDLLSSMNMNIELYEKIKNNMIFNWKDSLSKSILHSVQHIYNDIPNVGENVFNDLKTQTMFLIIASRGYSSRNVFGNYNEVSGLQLISYFKDLKSIPNQDPNLTEYDEYSRKNIMQKWSKISGELAKTTATKEAEDKVNDILKYVWIYVFYNKYLLNNGLKNKSIKPPKYLYRGIRWSNVYSKGAEKFKKEFQDITDKHKGTEHSYRYETKDRFDIIINDILKDGFNKYMDGKFLSFTASQDISKYFSNKEGFIVRIDTSKVDIITSELTDELFDRPDNVSGKKEREYIVRIPDDYKFNKEDITISDTDYLIADNNPLSVAMFNHDNQQAYYDITDDKGVVWHINAYYVWHSNTNGGVVYNVKNDKGETNSWAEGRKKVKQDLKFDPMPTPENLDRIKNFTFKEKKNW